MLRVHPNTAAALGGGSVTRAATWSVAGAVARRGDALSQVRGSLRWEVSCQKVGQHVDSMIREEALRVKLHALDG